MTNRNRTLRILLAALALLAVLALPAFAEGEKGEANITPQTTMKELRENPSIKGSGLYTYVYVWERDCGFLQNSKDNDTLQQVIGKQSVNSCVAGINFIIETYNAGTQITYKLFTPEEIAQDKSRDHVELYYFPAEQPNAKYAVVLSGNALFYSGEMRGGVSTAWELHQRGYAVFALRYRIGKEAKDNALLGYSSGGQITGVFCGKELGYRNYNVPKPGVLLLVYPINNFYEAKPIYHLLLDTHGDGRRYYDENISGCVDADFPPTYFWYARNDVMLMAFNYWQQGPALQQALAANGVPYQERVYRCAQHGVGIAEGTDAEGWIEEAAAFWKAHTAP